MPCPSCGAENRDGARFCDTCGAPLDAGPAREQRKVVTVLFCDVAGSTAMGEQLDPEALRILMSAYFDIARAAIERHGGTLVAARKGSTLLIERADELLAELEARA